MWFANELLWLLSWTFSNVIVFRWLTQDTNHGKTALVQVMAWCHQATSHLLSWRKFRSMSPYGVKRPHRVNVIYNPQNLTKLSWLSQYTTTKIYKANTRMHLETCITSLASTLPGTALCSCTLQWRHNERDGVSNLQPHDCLLNRLFGRRSKKTSKLRVTGLCARNSPVTGKFPAQRASNAENVSIWRRHHVAISIWFGHLGSVRRWKCVCSVCPLIQIRSSR